MTLKIKRDSKTRSANKWASQGILILLLAFSMTLTSVRQAKACAIICCTPYTYLQFCCYGCLNIDFTSIADKVSQVTGTVANLGEIVTQANEFRQELDNDVVILQGLGQSRPNLNQIFSEFAYSQGITFMPSGISVTNEYVNFKNLYTIDNSTNNFASPPSQTYDAMITDMNNNYAESMGYSSKALADNTQDLHDVENIATSITTTTDMGEDLQVNSQANEELINLEQLHTLLMAQYLGVASRSAAFAQQSDLTQPVIPNDN